MKIIEKFKAIHNLTNSQNVRFDQKILNVMNIFTCNFEGILYYALKFSL